MKTPVQLEIFPRVEFDRKEILRYAGAPQEKEDFSFLLEECLSATEGIFTPKVAYTKLKVQIKEDLCDFGFFSIVSESLSRYLGESEETLLFAATVGIGIDRLILRYTRTSPSKALFFSAIGSQQVEGLCDAFCRKRTEEGLSLLPRFSPGYGDVPLESEKDILSLFEKSGVGIYLSDGNLMTPTKSVTAFVGIQK